MNDGDRLQAEVNEFLARTDENVGAGLLEEPLPTIHSLRHTAAAWWLASGLTVHAVAELLGHADPTLVIKLYGHALESERSTAGERLEAFLAAAAR